MGKEKNMITEDITLTKNAAKRVNAILTGEKKEGYFLRVSVTNGGCSGMSYNLTFDNNSEAGVRINMVHKSQTQHL